MKFLTLTLILLLFSLGVSAQTSVDHEKENGGGECDKRITYIKEDINNWLNADGHMGLELPEGLSHSEYKESMLLAIADTVIECTTNVITVNGAEKTCVNMPGKMTCNIESFMEHTSEDGQYGLIHHEYAGLAGFEINDGEAESNYVISDQITGFLETVEVRRLAVTKPDGEFVDLCYAGGIGMYLAISVGAETCSKVNKQKLQEIKKLRIQNFSLPQVNAEAFKYLENLESLSIDRCHVREIEKGAFLGLSNLKTLELKHIEFENLEKDLFHGMPMLERLVITSLTSSSPISLKYIEDGAFEPLHRLRVLELSYNKLQSVNANTFLGMERLEILHVPYNELTTLPEDIFKWLDGLEEFVVWKNKWELGCVPEAVYDTAKSRFSGSRRGMDWYHRSSKPPQFCN